MAKRLSDQELGIQAEQHPESKRWRYLYVSPNAAECLGVFKHDTEEAALREGRAFARKQAKANGR